MLLGRAINQGRSARLVLIIGRLAEGCGGAHSQCAMFLAEAINRTIRTIKTRMGTLRGGNLRAAGDFLTLAGGILLDFRFFELNFRTRFLGSSVLLGNPALESPPSITLPD